MSRAVKLSTIVCSAALVVAFAPFAAESAQASTASSVVSVSGSVRPLTSGSAAARSGDYCGPGSNNWKSWFIPDHFYQADWSSDCAAHDRCYSSSSIRDRKSCDSLLLDGMIDECASAIANADTRVRCINRARTYYDKVRKYAKPFYHGRGSSA